MSKEKTYFWYFFLRKKLRCFRQVPGESSWVVGEAAHYKHKFLCSKVEKRRETVWNWSSVVELDSMKKLKLNWVEVRCLSVEVIETVSFELQERHEYFQIHNVDKVVTPTILTI